MGQDSGLTGAMLPYWSCSLPAGLGWEHCTVHCLHRAFTYETGWATLYSSGRFTSTTVMLAASSAAAVLLAVLSPSCVMVTTASVLTSSTCIGSICHAMPCPQPAGYK